MASPSEGASTATVPKVKHNERHLGSEFRIFIWGRFCKSNFNGYSSTSNETENKGNFLSYSLVYACVVEMKFLSYSIVYACVVEMNSLFHLFSHLPCPVTLRKNSRDQYCD